MTCMNKKLGVIIDTYSNANNEPLKTTWLTIVHIRGSDY